MLSYSYCHLTFLVFSSHTFLFSGTTTISPVNLTSFRQLTGISGLSQDFLYKMLLLFRCDCEGACGGHGSLFKEVRVEDLPTPKTRGPQKCDECGKFCKSEYHLQKHKAMHKPILEVDLCCPKCGKGFENKHRRAGHIGKCKGKETETEKEKRTETLQEETTSNNKKE